MTIQFGIIADDFTGASDIACFLAKGGFQVIQCIGIPDAHYPCPDDVDAIVISLKTRSIDKNQAVAQSLAACRWLTDSAGAKQIYFKYCSTFDSTADGNIGQVTEALMAELQTDSVIHCPALPDNGRTVIHGYLFVNGLLLNHSGMEHHPVNPMTTADIKQLLAPQIDGVIERLNLVEVQNGARNLRKKKALLKHKQKTHIIIDSLTNADLDTIAKAFFDAPLLAGGSGLGGALARFICKGQPSRTHQLNPPLVKKRVVLSGSCSLMTNQQVNFYKQQAPSRLIDIEQCLAVTADEISQVADWIEQQQTSELAPLVYATQPADQLKQIQQRYGKQASLAVEHFFALLSRELVVRGFNVFIVAGGETSGTIVSQLKVTSLKIGPQIVAGVPWVEDLDNGYCLALKSGNFGDENFFKLAQEIEL